MAYDSKLPNDEGAGWIVERQ